MTWKHRIFRLLGKDPEAVVVSFCSGPPDLARRMLEEVRTLVPDREHFAVTHEPIAGVRCVHPADLPGPLRRKRIGLVPVLITNDPEARALRWRAFRMAPTKLLAYNASLERHHLRLRSLIASLLFLRGIPLDRIWLRPKWFPFRRERSLWPSEHTLFEGRPFSESRRRVAVLSPYFPFPLSHGGAVRIFNLLREASRDYDIVLFSFSDWNTAPEWTPVLDYCAKVILFPQPRYREPRWASINPPEVNEFFSPYVVSLIREYRQRYNLRLLQTEYTQMASYGGDVLVEHDVTFDLYLQVHRAKQTLSSWWDLWRWRFYENRVARRFRSVVVMSQKDAELLGLPKTTVIPNGVDLHRFRPEPESQSEQLLFIGSFAHFPNVVACRWFLDEVWPLLTARRPGLRFTIIAGRNPERYWSPEPSPGVEFHGFISDVRPFYAESTLVVVPTRVSAGTNLKVIEAMASERAVVSTSSGVAGLDLTQGQSVLIADEAAEFAVAIESLLSDHDLRRRIAAGGRQQAEARFGWDRIGALQRRLWTELLTGNGIRIRRGKPDDLPGITWIQLDSHGASKWDPETYFIFDVHVAEREGSVCGFMVSRTIAPDEAEILNVAVAPEARKLGVATALIEALSEPEVFLEVRESNAAARALYSKIGFRVVGRRENYYDDPVESAFVMRRSRVLLPPPGI